MRTQSDIANTFKGFGILSVYTFKGLIFKVLDVYTIKWRKVLNANTK